MHEKKTRSMIKSLSYRISSIMLTALIVYMLTKDLTLSLEVGAIDGVAKFLWYFTHERIWDNVEWGRKK